LSAAIEAVAARAITEATIRERVLLIDFLISLVVES
jgi:hypothetical protein